ncbi:hypothetical protein [Streptomyces sp. NPDC006193]|uniref:hypothetical protein n=1 Tax=Streptomyces sp. NPDC006193 TaxID=3155717 RepID=UPI0033A261A1
MTYDAFPEYPSAPAADDGQEQRAHTDGPLPFGEDLAYVSPALLYLGRIRALTLGSSPSGNADANAQYYW